MKIVCPNDPFPNRPAKRNKSHKRFSVVAHVSQEWEVDHFGEFQKEIQSCIDVVHKPEKSDIYTCCTCKAVAKVQD